MSEENQAILLRLNPAELAKALQEAWDEFCVDTGCIPEDFHIHGPATTRVSAEFGVGNFCSMVVAALARRNSLSSSEGAGQ